MRSRTAASLPSITGLHLLRQTARCTEHDLRKTSRTRARSGARDGFARDRGCSRAEYTGSRADTGRTDADADAAADHQRLAIALSRLRNARARRRSTHSEKGCTTIDLAPPGN